MPDAFSNLKAFSKQGTKNAIDFIAIVLKETGWPDYAACLKKPKKKVYWEKG